jgi:hypothetical protein
MPLLKYLGIGLGIVFLIGMAMLGFCFDSVNNN